MPEEKQIDTFPDDVRIMERTLRASIPDDDDESEGLKTDVVKYIIQMFNPESLEGAINYDHFCSALDKAMFGLVSIVYIKHYTKNLEKRDSVFDASLVLISFMLTRLYQGLHYKKILEEIRAKGGLIGMQANAPKVITR